MALQFCSLDDRGLINIWSLSSERLEEEAPLRLVKGAAIDTSLLQIDLTFDMGPFATALECFPTDTSQFLIGTVRGTVIRSCRWGNAQKMKLPIIYQTKSSNDSSFENAQVTSIAFHPTFTEYFLVANGNGNISLFKTTFSTSLATWKMESGVESKQISKVVWSSTRDSIFYATSCHGDLYVWNCLQDSFVGEPVDSVHVDTAFVENRSFSISYVVGFLQL